MQVKSILPGLGLATFFVALSFGIENIVKYRTSVVVSPLVIAVVFGAVAKNFGWIPRVCTTGLNFSSKKLLRLGIVLLGFQLSFDQLREIGGPGLTLVVLVVGFAFFATQFLAKRLGLSRGLGLLVATGFSICGASAIAAVRPVSDADDDDMAYAIALVTICGTLAIFVLPYVAGLLSFEGVRFGSWVGASVHDVAQTVATAAAGNQEAQHAAIIVKLSRVILLAPLVAGVGIVRHRKIPPTVARPPLVPLFVGGFILAIVANTVIGIPSGILRDLKWIEKALLSAALVGLGAGVDLKKLKSIGLGPLVLGLTSWVLIATISALGASILN